MTATPQVFRGFMLASLVLSILAFVIDLTVPALVPDIVRFAEEQYWSQSSAGGLMFRASLLLLYVAASLVAFVGLYFFKRWARTANLVLSALLIVVAPALGHIVLSGIAQGLGEIALLLWGAVLAMAYFSPLSERFEASRGPVPSATS